MSCLPGMQPALLSELTAQHSQALVVGFFWFSFSSFFCAPELAWCWWRDGKDASELLGQNDTAAFISQGHFNDGSSCPAPLTPSLRTRIRHIRHGFIAFGPVYFSYVYFCRWPDILREAFLCLHGDERPWRCRHPLETNRCSSSSETLRCEIKEEKKWDEA